jgi:riboflavin kinase/FMN adenylyltransferase
MKVFSDLDALPAFTRPVVTVGSFDGVHMGHRHLLAILRARAEASGGESVVVTFAEHPRRVLNAGEELMLLTTPDEKAALLAAAGVDNLVVMPFDEGVAGMSPEEFIRDFIVGRLGARELVVGYNHRFGHAREGSAEMLRRLEGVYGFRIVEATRFGDEKISSTEIRRAIARGDMAAAEKMLGRKFS